MKIDKFYKYIFIFILSISFYIMISIISHEIPLDKQQNFFEVKKVNKLQLVSYKGNKILKSKLINDYLNKVSNSYLFYKQKERERIDEYLNLTDYFGSKQSELKKKLLSFISKIRKRTITKINAIFLSRNDNFGNNLVTINNCIFYCEILGCRKIILNKNQSKRKWLIKNPIYINEIDLTIKLGSNINCQNDEILCLYEISWIIYYPKIILPQVRTNLVKTEILKNLPKVKIQSDSLYIHIRSGDIFTTHISSTYAQPPLCFYEKIINNNKFKNIYIIAKDRENVVIDSLIGKHKNIVYNINNLEYDISLLSHAYKLVLSVSSFSLSSVKLNDNLKDLWEYDIMRISEKIHFLHHHLFKFNIQYKIHTMEPSDIYLSKMFAWKKTPEQLKLMLEDNCPNDFVTTKPNI